MGTRGCVGWTMTGKTYKETYNHYDSYPEWLGIKMIAAVKDLDMDVLKKSLKTLIPLKQNDKATEDHKKAYQEYADDINGQGQNIDNYFLFRSLQGSAFLKEVVSGKVKHFPIVKGWMKDSLFCEYAYILNFKKGEECLEFWVGFQHDPKNPDKYLPCKKIGSLYLNEIKALPLNESVQHMFSLYGIKMGQDKLKKTIKAVLED